MSRVKILEIQVDRVTMAEAVARCRTFLDQGGPHLVVTPNAEIAYAASRDPELAAIVNGADLVVADGAGVVLGSRLLGDPLPERVAGVDLTIRLLEELSARGGSLYLLGARPESVTEAARRVRQRFPGIREVGYRDGFFTPADEPAIIAEIRQRRPDMLLVGLGAPKQERWLARHLQALGVPICVGAGGTIDVLAGVSPRAPAWMRQANLEWLYRVVRMGRIRRSMPPLIKFMLRVTVQRLRGR